jgi:N-acetylmuramoyl-L-alanine amidase
MRVRGPRLIVLFLGWLGLLLGAASASAATQARVKDVRLWSGPEGTRLVIELTRPVEYDVFPLGTPDRVVIDLANTSLAGRELPVGQGPVRRVRSGPQPGNGLRLVLDVDSPQPPKHFMVGPDGSSGHRIVVELPGKSTPAVAASAGARPAAGANAGAPAGKDVLAMAGETSRNTASPVAETPKINEPPTPAVKSIASTGRDLVIAIDAGHGGQDPGAIGRNGTREKEVTLAIARKLAAAINREDGMRAVLIRDGDYFVSLAERTRKARKLGADMFISIHADSVLKRDVSGSSVYVLSLRGASDEAARWLAESENAADLRGGVPIVEDDLLASVLLDVTQKEAISDSVEAADNVLASLASVGAVHGNRRVRHAGFVVLKSPHIPSMLIETGFISNTGDERRLRDSTHQQNIADAIRAGIRSYWYDNPPPGTRLATLAAARRGGTAVAAK